MSIAETSVVVVVLQKTDTRVKLASKILLNASAASLLELWQHSSNSKGPDLDLVPLFFFSLFVLTVIQSLSSSTEYTAKYLYVTVTMS